MPVDPTLLPALELELEYAKHLKPGGQVSDPGRIKAIEDQIKLCKAATKPAEPEVENQSNVSTDYESHDDKVKTAKTKAKPERAVEAPEVETTDA